LYVAIIIDKLLVYVTDALHGEPRSNPLYLCWLNRFDAVHEVQVTRANSNARATVNYDGYLVRGNRVRSILKRSLESSSKYEAFLILYMGESCRRGICYCKGG
jgi:hypothetical protein